MTEHKITKSKQAMDALQLNETAIVQSNSQLNAIRYSACGRYLFGAAYDATIQRWDIAGEKPKALPPLKGHNGWLSRIAISPNKTHLFSADSWGELRCWDYAGEQPQLLWQNKQAHDGWIRDLDVNEDGTRVATCGRDRMIRIWSNKGKLDLEFDASEFDLFVIAMHPDGKHVACGDMKGNVKLWNIATKKIARQFNASQLYKYDRIQDVCGLTTLQFQDSGKTLVLAGTAPTRGATLQGIPTALFFDTATAKLKNTFNIGQAKDGHITDLARHNNGFYAAVTSGVPGNGRFVLFDAGTSKLHYENTKILNCHSIAIRPDGKRIAVCSTNRGSNGNGRKLNKDGEYEGNHSPIQFFKLT